LHVPGTSSAFVYVAVAAARPHATPRPNLPIITTQGSKETFLTLHNRRFQLADQFISVAAYMAPLDENAVVSAAT